MVETLNFGAHFSEDFVCILNCLLVQLFIDVLEILFRKYEKIFQLLWGFVR